MERESIFAPLMEEEEEPLASDGSPGPGEGMLRRKDWSIASAVDR